MNEIDTGRKAELLLNDEIFTNAIDEVMKEVTILWMGTTSEDAEGREALYRELHGLKAVIARLKAKVQAGHITEREL